MFVSRACEQCQQLVDCAVLMLVSKRWPDALTPAQIARLTA